MDLSDEVELRAGPRLPVHHSIKLPPDLSAILHRLSFETGVTKQELVVAAVRKVYGGQRDKNDP